MDVVQCGDPTFREQWTKLARRDPIRYPMYTPLYMEYLRAYAAWSSYADRSFLLTEGGEPVLGVGILAGKGPDGVPEWSVYGNPILYLEAAGTDFRTLKGAHRVLRRELQETWSEVPGAKVRYRDFLPSGCVTPPGELLLEEHEAVASPHVAWLIDLRPPEAELRAGLRSSYKSLINWGLRNLDLSVWGAADVTEERVEAFRSLHLAVAGRETRSRRSWEVQLELVRNGEAFLVLGELAGELVTAAFFSFNGHYCYYGVSASRRELFDRPLSHAVIWTAMLHAKQAGGEVFEMGEQVYPGTTPAAGSEKLVSISRFKRGFGGSGRVRLDVVANGTVRRDMG